MADWLKYKGEGPWECIPPNKITYDEGDKTTSVLDPVWVIDQDGITDRTKHDPCGYWPRLPYTPPPEESFMFDVYHEMLPGETAHVSMLAAHEYVYSMETFVSFNPLDYDGVEKFIFEVIGMNKTEFPFKVMLVDDTYVSHAEVIIPANTEGATGYELARLSVEFTPIAGVLIYGLKFVIDAGSPEIAEFPLDVVVENARIIVRQNGASKTRIQIPMFASDYNFAASGGAVDHISLPIGYNIFNATGYTGVNDYTNKWPSESGTLRDSDTVTSVWQYSDADINPVSKVVLSVLARGATMPADTVKTIVMINSLAWVIHSYWGLYTTPIATSDAACASGSAISGSDMTDFVWQDGCTGGIFTPIPNSLMEPEPDPWSITLYPDLSGISGSVDVFMGWIFDGSPWQHGTKWFTVSVLAGRTIVDAVMTVVPGSTNLRKDVTLTYKIVPEVMNSLYVALFDIDTNTMVAGSEQVWATDSGWIRKDVEIPVGNLISGHEYEFRVKCVDHYYVSAVVAPEIADVQLLLNIDPIEHLTTWHRVFHRADTTRDNYYTPVAWGGDYFGYGTGANCIMHRSELYLPDGGDVRFEQVAYTRYNDSVEEAVQFVSLLDLTVDDATGSGENGVEVVGGKISYTNTDYDTRTRKRSLALPVTHASTYGAKYGESEDGYIIPIKGFLVTKVK